MKSVWAGRCVWRGSPDRPARGRTALPGGAQGAGRCPGCPHAQRGHPCTAQEPWGRSHSESGTAGGRGAGGGDPVAQRDALQAPPGGCRWPLARRAGAPCPASDGGGSLGALASSSPPWTHPCRCGQGAGRVWVLGHRPGGWGGGTSGAAPRHKRTQLFWNHIDTHTKLPTKGRLEVRDVQLSRVKRGIKSEPCALSVRTQSGAAAEGERYGGSSRNHTR